MTQEENDSFEERRKKEEEERRKLAGLPAYDQEPMEPGFLDIGGIQKKKENQFQLDSSLFEEGL